MQKDATMRPGFSLRGVLILIGVILVVGIGLYWYQVPSKKEKYISSLAEGRDLKRRGDGRSAIRFEDALRNATNKDSEAIAKLNIATDFFDAKPIQGLSMLHELSADESYHSRFRSDAMFYIAVYYSGSQDPAFAQKNIFIGDLWGKFLAVKPGTNATLADTHHAMRNALEAADNLYPLPATEYGISLLYGYDLVFSNLSADIKNDYTVKALDYLKRGDNGMQEVFDLINQGFNLADGAEKYSTSHMVMAQLWKGNAIDFLARSGADIDPYGTEEAFRKAAYYVDLYPTAAAQVPAASMRVSLSAAILRRNAPGAAAEVAKVLRPLYELYRKNPELGYFALVAGRSDRTTYAKDAMRQNIILVANTDSEFRSFLKAKLEWEESDFK